MVLVEVYFIHRGAPGDTRMLKGDRITRLDQLFFHTDEDTIPYHRIYKITYKGKPVFNRPFRASKPGSGHHSEMTQ